MERPSSKELPQILKVLVGSHAHGLATPESDYDYRAVFVQPTTQILSLGSKAVSNQWIEGDVDNTAYEIGHFLFLATKSNPTILETFVAPGASHVIDHFGNVIDQKHIDHPYRQPLLDLFPHVWDTTALWNAFKGYGYNQRKKFLDDKDKRANKYAVAWLRTLIMAYDMLTEGTMTLDLKGHPEFDRLYLWKNGFWSLGEVMEITDKWIQKVDAAYEKAPKKAADLDKINGFLLDVRKAFWD
jgi:predicted nucleotidyltransferase